MVLAKSLAPLIRWTKRIIKEAAQTALEQKRHLVDVVRGQTHATINWEALKAEERYLGSTDLFIQRILSAVRKQRNS